MLKGVLQRGIYDDLYGGDSLGKVVDTSWASVGEPAVNDKKRN